MPVINEIKSIQFGFQSDQDVLDRAVCEINKPSLVVEEGSVYDPRLGCTDNESMCVTCHQDVWTCTGHFGYISLNIPVIIHYKQAVTILKCFCFECHRLLVSKELIELRLQQRLDSVLQYIQQHVKFCNHELRNGQVCNTYHPDIKYDPNENTISMVIKHKTLTEVQLLTVEKIKLVFDNIVDDDVLLLGLDPTMFHPRSLVLTKFPVIPTCCRPRMITTDNISDDDLSLVLMDILKLNDHLSKNTFNEKIKSTLRFKIFTYCDNSRGKALHTTNHKPMVGIKERLSKKSGHVRQNLMGKRCDQTARTVVGPDPTLKLNQVAIPQEMAQILTLTEHVTPLTIDRLTRLVNTPKKASVVITKQKRISVPIKTTKFGTILHHGDTLYRRIAVCTQPKPTLTCGCCKKKMTVTWRKIPLHDDDVIVRHSDGRDQIVPTVLPTKNHLELAIGDKVERFLQDGDFILLNRQPTLHRNSMQGMQVVIKPGRTIRLNLAIVTGFNMDFDGDEGNVFVQETLESRAELEYLSNAKYNILSNQTNKSEMVIVQDSLLGAFRMTYKVQTLSRVDFINCLHHIHHAYDVEARLEKSHMLRHDNTLTTHDLFGFILPSDFFMSYDNLEIKQGVIIHGYLNKKNINSGSSSLIRLLCLEYGEKVAAEFIDNIQFLTNYWLSLNPFSISIEDCFVGQRETSIKIKQVIATYFKDANHMARITDHELTRESRVNCALNKAKDIGLRIAKETLLPDNNFISTVASGSKGDYFNIAQITGLLGQQNLNGHRLQLVLNNNTRSLIHYPLGPIVEPEQRYTSRGFVSSSFIQGMSPEEMFFHAMSGREGIIKTAMGTATSGYIQRSIVKINEDLKIEYDGTVRDARKNIYQILYGYHGFDLSMTQLKRQNFFSHPYPVNIQRLAHQLNSHYPQVKPCALHDQDIKDIIQASLNQHVLFEPIRANLNFIRDQLQQDLESITVVECQQVTFKERIITCYNRARANPGECVGILGAQSIGERQTQTTLNTFHTAGKLQLSSVNRLEEILNMSRKLKVYTCILYFKEKYTSASELRQVIGNRLVSIKMENVCCSMSIVEKEHLVTMICFDLDPKLMYKYRLHSYHVAKVISKKAGDLLGVDVTRVDIGPTSVRLCYNHHQETRMTASHVRQLFNPLRLCGLPNITNIMLDFDGQEWFVVTEGSNLRELLALPDVDVRRLYCNNFWEVYECLGIVATKKMLFQDLKRVVKNVNLEHIQLLIDKMTFKGKPCSITRYTMRNNDVGPLSKATFEESADILLTAALKTEVENNTGVSAAIISGNQPRVGTGFMGMFIDHKKLNQCIQPEVVERTIPQVYY